MRGPAGRGTCCGQGQRARRRPRRRVRNETTRRSKRFGGMASTRSITPACSGWRRAAKRKRECTAASRALRVRTVLPRLVFEVVQERRDQSGRRGPRAASVAGALPVSRSSEAEQEAEGVPIGGDGVGARLALGHEPLGEECLERGGQRAHGRGSVACSRRSAASPSSSGAPDKYQYVLAGWTWPR